MKLMPDGLPPAPKEVRDAIEKRAAEAWSQTWQEILSFGRVVADIPKLILQMPRAVAWLIKFTIKVIVALLGFVVVLFLLLTVARLVWKLILFAWA